MKEQSGTIALLGLQSAARLKKYLDALFIGQGVRSVKYAQELDVFCVVLVEDESKEDSKPVEFWVAFEGSKAYD